MYLFKGKTVSGMRKTLREKRQSRIKHQGLSPHFIRISKIASERKAAFRRKTIGRSKRSGAEVNNIHIGNIFSEL
jgi:hypothetical protein